MSEAAKGGKKKVSPTLRVLEGGGGIANTTFHTNGGGGGGGGEPYATVKWVEAKLETVDERIKKLPKLWQIAATVGGIVTTGGIIAVSVIGSMLGNVTDSVRSRADIQAVQQQQTAIISRLDAIAARRSAPTATQPTRHR